MIRVCTMCDVLGFMAEATDEQTYRVLSAARVDVRHTKGVWRVRVWICPNCETPIVELYPERMAQSRRREQLIEGSKPLQIDEGGAG